MEIYFLKPGKTGILSVWKSRNPDLKYFSLIAVFSVSVAGETTTNYEGLFNKFCKLSYFDQHAVTSSCATSVVEQVNSFASASSSYLPLIDNMSYLFDMMEHSYNISGLLEFLTQVCDLLSVSLCFSCAPSRKFMNELKKNFNGLI